MADIKDIELARPGIWQLASGKTTFTDDHLRDAAEFFEATGGQKIPLALGHSDPRFSGDPSFGNVANVRYEEDERGPVLKGDLVDMPEWLHAAAPKRWPNRSIEGFQDFEYDGRKYKLVLTALALLGVSPPGVRNISSLQDLQLALAASSARRIVAKFNPHQLRDPGGENGGQWIKAPSGVGHDLPEHGRRSKVDGLKAALNALTRDEDTSDANSGVVTFSDRQGAEPGRLVKWERQSKARGTDGFNVFDLYFAHSAGTDDEESIRISAGADELEDLNNKLGLALLRSDPPPVDPEDPRSQALHAMLLTSSFGAGVQFGNDGEDGYLDISRDGEGFYLESGDSDGDVVTYDLSLTEIRQFQAMLALTLIQAREEEDQIFGPIVAAAAADYEDEDEGGAHVLDDDGLECVTCAKKAADDAIKAMYSPEQPRVPSGSASGGQFAPSDSGSSDSTPKKPAPSRRKPPVRHGAPKSRPKPDIPDGQLGFDGKTGTGYGTPDARVKDLQTALNRLHLTDDGHRKLRVDGEFGPLTTQAVKKAQQRLGMEPTGIVSPEFVDKLKTLDRPPRRKKKTLASGDDSGELDVADEAVPGCADCAGEIEAAADTHPGGEELKHYWLHGEGAAKWSTWTELYHHLRKHMNLEMAKRVAAQWFHERYSIWPGSDANRVAHGKQPRGEKVGPG